MAATFLSESVRWRYLNFDGVALLVYPLLLLGAAALGHPHWQAAGMAAIALLALLAWGRAFLRYRRIVDTPTSQVASAAQGYVELHGSAQLLGPADAIGFAWTPPAVWLRYAVYRRDGERWGLVERGQSASVFALEDASGRCLVDPEGAEVIASRRFHQQKGDFLYRGEYIAPGDELYLLGQLTTSGGYGDPEETRQEIGALVSTWKEDRNFLLNQFDANRDGEIDLDEWQAVRAAATANVHARQRDYDLDPVSHRIGAPPGWLPYLLSDLPERRVAPRYRRWALVHLVLFLLAGALATWLAQRPVPLPESATSALFVSAPVGVSVAVDGQQLEPNPLFNQGQGSLTTFTLRVPLGTRLLLAGYPDGRQVEYRLEIADEQRQLLVLVPGEPGGRLTVH